MGNITKCKCDYWTISSSTSTSVLNAQDIVGTCRTLGSNGQYDVTKIMSALARGTHSP